MEFLAPLNFNGLIIGLFTFIIIGLLHSLIIKVEYYWGIKPWRVFLAISIISAIASIVTPNFFISALCGILAFTSFWSIFEIFQQVKRVKRGWFPENPKRKS
ncbi:MAG: DUF4491 family protein [Candidatus Azobacteroides pseudotrichonymphae]|jgi:hypothetical protein|nr:MAG: DUF4491 family protein [Candidatus Azobacteroides pseudotrichonymphae]